MANKNEKSGLKSASEPGTDPIALFRAYLCICRSIGLKPNQSVRSSLRNKDNPKYGKEILIDGSNDDERSPCLGPGGCRALSLALLGEKLGDTEGSTCVYKSLRELHIWRGRIGDYGAVALAKLLIKGGPNVRISTLDLMDNGIGPQGAVALGRSLCVGGNKSLITMNLDFNTTLGSEGITALCKGVRTNSTLQNLSVRYCAINQAGGESIGNMLSSPKNKLLYLDLGGNLLRGEGLLAMCQGLKNNQSLKKMGLADNCIQCKTEEDANALNSFAGVLVQHPSMKEVNLTYNNIGMNGGIALLPVIESKNLTYFCVDTSVPDDLYNALCFNRPHRKGKKKTGRRRQKMGKKIKM